MGLMNTLATSALGNAQKALLVIHKQQDSASLDSSRVAAAAEAALSLANSLNPTLNSLDSTNAAMGLMDLGTHTQSSVLQVQYNPSSLTIQANAESIPFTYLQQNIDNGIPNQNARPPMVVLSVQLVFDAMNPKDAFMAEKFTSISIGGIASSAAGVAKAMEGGYTVQPQTNALLAALMRPSTRIVTFRWADMAFTGQLIEVEADYTMFSVSGKPIRSTVQMNIAQQVESDADLQYWDKALDKAIADKTLEKGKGYDQSLGNLLNLG